MLINELKAKIEGGFLRKFYDLGGGAFRFGFYREGRNVAVYCKLLITFNETMYAETGGQATQFAIAMRRRIEGLRLLRLYQHGADRIIVMDLEGKGLQHRLIIEMFGKGNMVLVDGEGITELAYTLASYRERVVKPRTQYALPKSSSMFRPASYFPMCLDPMLHLDSARVFRHHAPPWLPDSLRSLLARNRI